MPRVLITRPEPGASKTARKVRGMGFTPLVLPLTRIESLPAIPSVESSDFAAIALTSPNSARHAPPELVRSLAGLPAYAVGSATAAVACEAGFNVVDESAGDAEGLHRVIAERVTPGAGILVLCGRVRRSVLEQGLRDSGYAPRLVEVYDTVPASPSDDEIAAVLGSGPVDAVLLYSAYAAEEFLRLIEGAGTSHMFETARFIVMSARIGEQLPAALRARAAVAPEPNEDAMLSTLAGNLPHFN
ncbi:uroporphyrinogen-III synthase [Chelativorans composti]|jgi:Uroporphyrinogen-III synthase|uniref:Uroporphyrinogen-III synthase n=1 Tax=Chelativorans composti TaxID=768533 RepID=A0ABW5DEV8_9HYPH